MTNWQPMETAPKNGTWVLLWCPGASKARDYDAQSCPDLVIGNFSPDIYAEPAWRSCEVDVELHDYGGMTGVSESSERRQVYPIAWMPQPAPPEGEL